LGDEERPEPKDGEVRVRVQAAGVSLPDLLMREGVHPETPPLPFTPGWDLVGVVDRFGDGISGIEPGQTVAALPITGAYSEFVCLPQRELVPALMSISFPPLKGLSVQANNNLATDAPSPIELNLRARRRRAANYCAARRGIFRASSMTEAATPSRQIGRAPRLRRGFLSISTARGKRMLFSR
jgi:hypothetical protein